MANAKMQPVEQLSSDNEKQAVVHKAIDVFSNREKAVRWLQTPVRALGKVTPDSLLDSESGRKRVIAILERIEYGVF